MLLSGSSLLFSTIVLLSKWRPGLWPNAAGSDHSCSFTLLNLSVWSACHLFIHEPFQCMAAMPAYPAPSPVLGISLLNLFLGASTYGSLNCSRLPEDCSVFFTALSSRPLRNLTWSCALLPYPSCVQLYLPYFCFRNAFKSVCHFFRWDKSGRAGEKPRPRLRFHNKNYLVAIAVQEILGFDWLLPFSG